MKILEGYQEKNLHFKWSSMNKPAMNIEPRETLLVRVPNSSKLRIKDNFTTEDLKNIHHLKVNAG